MMNLAINDKCDIWQIDDASECDDSYVLEQILVTMHGNEIRV